MLLSASIHRIMRRYGTIRTTTSEGTQPCVWPWSEAGFHNSRTRLLQGAARWNILTILTM
jgi:hypothetical protein